MGRFGGKKGKGEWCNYNLKKKKKLNAKFLQTRLPCILWGFKNMFLYPLSVSYMYKYVSIMIIVRIFAAKALKTPFRQIENLTDFILLLLLSGHGD